MPPSTLVLIDGHSLAFRAFHAIQVDLSTRSGELTNATFGFAMMLLNVLRDVHPEYIAVAFDLGRTFRHDDYAEYKATRQAMPDPLHVQMGRIRELVEAFNIPIFTREGYEADDVLGTLSRQAMTQGVDTVIVTGDTDAFQLITPQVRVMTSRRSFGDTVIYDMDAVRERYGLAPQQLIDYKALLGDKSDNVPGVPGIGEKTATQLLQTYGTLEGIYEHLAEITPKRAKEALEKNRELAYLSKHLVTIVTDIPCDLDLNACRTHDYDRDKVLALFREMEFISLVSKLPQSEQASGQPASAAGTTDAAENGSTQPPASSAHPAEPNGQLSLFGAVDLQTAPLPPNPYQVIDTPEKLARLVEALNAAPQIAFDVESTSLDERNAELVGISLAWDVGQAAYIPVGHHPLPSAQEAPLNLPLDLVREKLTPILTDSQKKHLAHNAKYDVAVLRHAGIPVGEPLLDTMIAEWLINPSSRALGLKGLAFTRLGVEMTQITDLIGTGKNQITMDLVPVERVAPYAAADADMTLRLAGQVLPELEEKGLHELFYTVEMPLIPVLVDMEDAGILLDVPYLQALGRELDTRLHELEQEIYRLVGHSFNINSPQQLSDVLFGKLGLSTANLKKTASGHFSTAVEVLEGFRGQNPVIDLILENRQLSKLKSTYVDALPQMVNPRTGRVHTDFNQTGSETGRLSSSNPNLQNIPIRSELGKRVRRAFIAAEGHRLVSADYSQIELRILAHITQDPALVEAFTHGVDIHKRTASLVYGVPIDQVTYQQRAVAKQANYAIIYGISGFGLAQRTELSASEANQFIERYFQTYPGVRRYLDETKRMAFEKGYVETLLGRRRYFPELKDRARSHYNARQAAERAAINAPIQGTAADIMKLVMIQMQDRLREHKLKTRLLLQVHDELVLEAPEDEVVEVARLSCQVMENAYALNPPLVADVEAGKNWEELEPIK